jgi:type I restriction enzyme S subunit
MFEFGKLFDVCLRITKGTTPTAQEGGFTRSGIKYIKSESLSYSGIIDETKFVFISPDTHEKLCRSQLESADILYSIAGANLGKCGLIKPHMLPANTNQAVAIIRVNPDRACPAFISYFLRQRAVVDGVLGSVAQSAQPNFNLTDLGRFRVPLPLLGQQKARQESARRQQRREWRVQRAVVR